MQIASVIIIIIYLGFLLLLYHLKTLPINTFYTCLTISIGWIVAYLMIYFQLRKTLEDNLDLKKKEIRKGFEVEAFRKINQAITDYSIALSEVHTKYIVPDNYFKFTIPAAAHHDFNLIGNPKPIYDDIVKILKASMNLAIAIEAYQIALLNYVHYDKFIGFRREEAIDMMREFGDFLQSTNAEKMAKEGDKNKFREYIKKIEDKLGNINGWLMDYRIILANHFMGELFNAHLPKRKPLDPRIKTLDVVASPEKVHEEQLKWEQSLVDK